MIARLFFSNTEVFNVCRESHSGAIKTAASDAHHVRALMMNGCLVCWFYGASAVRFSRGRRTGGVRLGLRAAHRGDVQLLAVTLSASHPAHLRT